MGRIVHPHYNMHDVSMTHPLIDDIVYRIPDGYLSAHSMKYIMYKEIYK